MSVRALTYLPRALFACALAAVVLTVGLGGSSMGATASTVVGVTVPSATYLDPAN